MKAQPLAPGFNINTYPFQRSSNRFHLRKVNKKTRLTLRHIILLFALAGGLTYLGSRLFLFLTMWEGLKVQQVKVIANKEEVKQAIIASISQVNFGNILKLNLKIVDSLASSHPWVKKVRVRKIFPSCLEIIIEERQPVATVKTPSYFYFIDKDGIKLETLKDEMETNLPVIFLANDSTDLNKEELGLILDCLQTLNQNEAASAKFFLLSNPTNLVLQFNHSPTLLILGRDYFQEKLALYHSRFAWFEANFGPLDYLDLRFYEDRVYFKPKAMAEQTGPEDSLKEEI